MSDNARMKADIPRTHLEPGIYRRGGVYEAHVNHAGRREQATFATLTEARKWRRKRQVDLDGGGAIARAGASLGPTLAAWLKEHGRQVSVNTRRMYGDDVRYWTAALGTVPLRKLTAALVAEGLARIGESRSPKTVKNALTTLRCALGWAVKRELIARNVALEVEAPKVPRYEIQPLTAAEAQALDAVFVEAGPPYGAMLRVALYTLTRVKSEWGAMRWRDVNLGGTEWGGAPPAGILTAITSGSRMAACNTESAARLAAGASDSSSLASASLARVRLQDGSIVQAGNSKHKRRTIPLPTQAVEAIKAQQLWQAKMRDACQQRGEPWCNDDEQLVFTNEWGEPVRQSSLQRAFKRYLRQAGIAPERVRIHDLRHTGATLLLLASVPVSVVQALLGHSSAQVTMNVYSHVLPGFLESGSQRLGELLAPDQARREAK